MMTDPIADLLTRIRNALMMHHKDVLAPYSRLKEKIVKIFKDEGFIIGYDIIGEKTKKHLAIHLKYSAEGEPAIVGLQRVSLPSRRVYKGYEDLKGFRTGLGVTILTTSKGIISNNLAHKQKVGGEILVEIW